MIGILSDIHGNYAALKVAVEELQRRGCRQIISLGDVAGYYSMINECIELLRENNIVNIMGNHDFYLVNKEMCPRSTSANICLEYQKNVIKESNLSWLAQSPLEVRVDSIWARHGGWTDGLDEYIREFDFDKVKEDREKIFLSGHTHIPRFQKSGSQRYCNPGSVGQPRDNDSRVAMALIEENGEIVSIRGEYDIEYTVYKMKEAMLPNYLSECLYYGEQIGGKHTTYQD